MPPKKRKLPVNLTLTPQVFAPSVAKLNIQLASSQNDTNSDSASRGDIPHDSHEHPTYCTIEAMEFLRQAHGQFVALVSSEMASGEEDPKKKVAKIDNDAVRTILPKKVKIALERLDFFDIASSPYVNDDSSGAGGGSKRGTKAARVKKTVKNVAMTEELLKEQERLFAISAAKMKDSSGAVKK
eukprot:scaffold932_cov278-Chaetoceros_neogracile.AAC.2